MVHSARPLLHVSQLPIMSQADGKLVLDDPYRTVDHLEEVLPRPNALISKTISTTDQILLIRLGGIGDAIRLLPTVAFLRNCGFKGPLHCAVEPPVDQILNCTSLVDQVHSIPLKSWKTELMSILGQIEQVRKTVFDWVFDCHGILKSGLLARLARATRRISYHPSDAGEANSLFMDYTITKLDKQLPRLLKYVQLVRPFLSEPHLEKSKLKPQFTQFEPVRSDVKQLAAQEPVLIHPSSSAGRYGFKKDWGTQNFQSFIRKISKTTSRNILITWGPGERSTAEEIADPFSEQVKVAPETTPITNLAHLIQHARMVITIDSSPAHFADLVGTPSVVIFGVGKTRINAPFFAPYRMVTREDEEPRTSDIPVERVFLAYRQLREELPSVSSTASTSDP